MTSEEKANRERGLEMQRETSKKESSFVYIRENSVNESKEQYSPVTEGYPGPSDELADKQCKMTAEKTPVKIVMLDRQNSTSPFVNTVEATMFSSNNKKLEDSYEDPILRKFRQLKKYVFCMSGCGFCMLTLATMLFVLLIFKTVPHSGRLTDDTIVAQSARQHRKTSGNFIVDQDILKESSEIRWLPDVYSIIQTVPNTTCVKVTMKGDYFVNSRFTFRIPTTEKRQLFTHTLQVIADNQKHEMFMRQYVNIPSNRKSEHRKTSVFTKIFHIKAGELICAEVSAQDLLYASGIDNDLTIVRLNDEVTPQPYPV